VYNSFKLCQDFSVLSLVELYGYIGEHVETCTMVCYYALLSSSSRCFVWVYKM